MFAMTTCTMASGSTIQATSQTMTKMSAPGRVEFRSKVDLWSSESDPEKTTRVKNKPKLQDESPESQQSSKAKTPPKAAKKIVKGQARVDKRKKKPETLEANGLQSFTGNLIRNCL
jgi:hypothetical protein